MYRVILVAKSIYFCCTELVSTDLVFCSTAFVCTEFDLQHDAKFLDSDCMLKPGQYCHGPSFHVSKYALTELIVDRIGYGPKRSWAEVVEVRSGC